MRRQLQKVCTIFTGDGGGGGGGGVGGGGGGGGGGKGENGTRCLKIKSLNAPTFWWG